jgi:uncharacterized protein YqkB
MFVIYCEEVKSLHHSNDVIGSFRYLLLQAGCECKHGVVTYKLAGSVQSLEGKINTFLGPVMNITHH